MFHLGIDQFISNKKLRQSLQSKRISFLGHPASQTKNCNHSLEELFQLKDIKITSAFGPQHGMRGEKQDNMIESQDYFDPEFKIPVFSLYGQVRKPTPEMMDTFDVLLVDLQDLGTRIYTFLTTVCYMIEACAHYKKEIWILDRPNPAGRPIEGILLQPQWESFVGIGPIPMRHGLTIAECAKWFVDFKKLDVHLVVVPMQNYNINELPDFGWPQQDLTWINPSPNATTLSMARCYPGTVIIEGTNLSEGRGTTRPLECLGAPQINNKKWIEKIINKTPEWSKGCALRPCFFQPTFHKFNSQICAGFQIHVDFKKYNHFEFKPYRLVISALRQLKELHPDFEIYRDFPYEYETTRLAFDVINGGPFVKQWINDSHSTPQDLDLVFNQDEKIWEELTQKYKLYS